MAVRSPRGNGPAAPVPPMPARPFHGSVILSPARPVFPLEQDRKPEKTDMRILLVTLALAAAPLSAAAMCSDDRHAAITCGEGKVWDEATKTCIVASS